MPTDNLTTVLGLIVPGLGHFARGRRVAAAVWLVVAVAAYSAPSLAASRAPWLADFLMRRVNAVVAIGLLALPGTIAHACCLISAAWNPDQPSTVLLLSTAILFPPAAIVLGWRSRPREARLLGVGAAAVMMAVDLVVWRAPLATGLDIQNAFRAGLI